MVNYPKYATKIEFKPFSSRTQKYYIWPGNKPWWFWYAVGNSGTAISREAACEAARTWIRDGIKGRQRGTLG